MRSQPAVLGPVQQPGNKVTPPAQVETVSFDVAEAASRFIFDEESVDEDRLPDYGNSFVTAAATSVAPAPVLALK